MKGAAGQRRFLVLSSPSGKAPTGRETSNAQRGLGLREVHISRQERTSRKDGEQCADAEGSTTHGRSAAMRHVAAQKDPSSQGAKPRRSWHSWGRGFVRGPLDR